MFSFLYSPTVTSVIRFRFPDKIILGLGWALKSMTGVLKGEKQRAIWERDPEEKVTWWWRQTLEWCIYQRRIVKDYSSPQKRGEIYPNSPSGPPETLKCIDTLISEFCPTELQKNFCHFQSSSYINFRKPQTFINYKVVKFYFQKQSTFIKWRK